MAEAASDRHHVVSGQKVDMAGLELPGLVLDIGGGGEGIIGRLFGSRVVAVDLRRDELEEAPAGPLKVVMDACDLKFLDNTFDAATAFFSLMFIGNAGHERVMAEAARVLKLGAPFVIWDVVIPKERPPDMEAFIVRLEVALPGGTVSTGYGVGWEGRHQDLPGLEELASRTGFDVAGRRRHDRVFRLDLRKRA